MITKYSTDDIDIETEFEKLDKIEVAIEDSQSHIYRQFLNNLGIDVEGFVDGIKELWARLKKLLKHTGNMAKKLWLRTLVFFASNDEKLSDYRSKVKNKLLLDMKNKGEIKDIMKRYILEASYGFKSNGKTAEELFKHDDNTLKDIIKEIKNPDQKIVDYLTGKSDIEFIRFDKDTVMFVVKSKENVQKDQYIKVVKSVFQQSTFNRLESKVIEDIEQNRFLVPMGELYESALGFEEIKKRIYDGFKSLKSYEDTANKLKIDDDSSLLKARKEFDTLKSLSRYTYASIRAEITKTKLAIRLGKLMFDEE